jgi:hypothetical protein
LDIAWDWEMLRVDPRGLVFTVVGTSPQPPLTQEALVDVPPQGGGAAAAAELMRQGTLSRQGSSLWAQGHRDPS